MIKYLSICDRKEYEDILRDDPEYQEMLGVRDAASVDVKDLCKAYTVAAAKNLKLIPSEKRRNVYRRKLEDARAKIDELAARAAEESRAATMERGELKAQKRIRLKELDEGIRAKESVVGQQVAKIARYAGVKYRAVIRERRKELRDEY